MSAKACRRRSTRFPRSCSLPQEKEAWEMLPTPLLASCGLGLGCGCGWCGLADDQAERAGGDPDRGAVGDFAFEDLLRQRVLQLALDHPLQRPRAVDRIVAGGAEPLAGLGIDVEHDLAVGQQLAQP